MQHSPRFLNYTTDRLRRHQRLKVAEENIVPARLDQTNAVAVAVTFLNLDSDFAARVPGQHRKGNGPRAFDAKPELSISGFTKASVRRQRDDFRVRKSGCKRAGRNPDQPICGPQRWSLAPGSVRLSQKSHKVAVLLGITLLSALSLPDRREGGIGGSRCRRPLELSSGGSKFP